MNLLSLRRACQLRTGYNDPAFDAHWDSLLNEALREHARVQPWEGLEDLINLVSDGTEYLILPQYVDSVLSLLNTDNHTPVTRDGDWDRLYSGVYSQRTTGSVFNYDKIGTVPALRDPTGYCVLYGSHASDAMALHFTGLVANSGASGTAMTYRNAALSINATGTSPLTLSSLFTRFTSVGKETNSNGDFYLYDAGSSLAHISFLGRYDDSAAFKRIQLLYKPSASTSFRARIRYRPQPLIDDAQAPHPAVKTDFLINHAIALFYAQQDQHSKAQYQNQKAAKVLQDEISKDNNHDEPHSRIIPYRYPDPDAPEGTNWF